MRDGLIYRHVGARYATWLLAGICVIAIALCLWNPALLPFSLFACVFAWFAALAWPFPLLALDERGILVRNPFSTTTIPYTSVATVTGGNRLAIEARGGLRVFAAAVPGRGNFTVNAIRKKDAYGDYFQPVKAVDDLRIDAGEDDTAATRIANIIRRRIALSSDEKQPSEAATRKLNWATVVVTAAITASCVVGYFVR